MKTRRQERATTEAPANVVLVVGSTGVGGGALPDMDYALSRRALRPSSASAETSSSASVFSSMKPRRQERATAEAPANVVLVVGSTGFGGGAVPDMVYALSRRALLPSSASAETTSSNLIVDLADSAAVAQALAPNTEITHFFYGTWSPCPGSTEGQAREANRGMLSNISDPNCPTLVHVCLQNGNNHSMDPVDPPTGIHGAICPHPELLPLLEYSDTEDVLRVEFTASRRDGAAIAWSVHRPTTTFGLSPRRASLYVYAGMRCKERVTPCWPGSCVACEGFSDASDAELVAEHTLWAALDPSGMNKVFNCTNDNGDVFKWKRLGPSPTLPKHFQVEWSGYDGEDKPFMLTESITTWGFVDAVIKADKDALINTDKEQLGTMNKDKGHVFLSFQRPFSTWTGNMKVRNLKLWRNLLAILWLISLLSSGASANEYEGNDICPIEPVESCIFARKTCPAVYVSAKHWVHTKRSGGDLTFYSTLTLSESLHSWFKQLGFLLVLVSFITPVMYIKNLNTNLTMTTILFWEAKTSYVWACNFVSSIIYYISWVLFDIIMHYKETQKAMSAWHIIYKNFSYCVINVLLLGILGYQQRMAIQVYLHTKKATRMWIALIVLSICWFWLCVIFDIASSGLILLALISMVPMYITKWLTVKGFKWTPFLMKVGGVVGLFIIHENGKHAWYERAYKAGIFFRLIELMIYGYPLLEFLKSMVKNRLHR